ncbi:MAG TPA: FtsX-like permease family protein [Candidatus Ozemobacteraceae bacterium]|nr:FtsX-like permease family protein [Candidatus Ozemobacteraceae bacterium]
MILRLAWRNLWRNPRRTLLQMLAVAGSLFVAVFFNNLAYGSYRQMIREGVKAGSGHVGIYHKRYIEERKVEQWFVVGSAAVALEGLPGVSGVFPRLLLTCLARTSHDGCGAAILGLDVAAEAASHPLLEPRRLVSGTLPAGARQVLVGDRLAAMLRLEPGRKLVVMFQGADGEIRSTLFRVSGIVHSGVKQMDAGMIVADRKELGEAFGAPDAAHELAILLDDPVRGGEVRAAIEAGCGLPASTAAFPWEKAMPQLDGAIRMDRVQFRFMILILAMIVGLGAANTLLMSVVERTREFGLVRALGFGPAAVRALVMAEGVMLGLLGMALGTVLGLLATWHASVHGIDFSSLMGEAELAGMLIDPVIFSGWDHVTTFWFNLGMLAVVAAASLYPAHKALQIGPAQAMRTF